MIQMERDMKPVNSSNLRSVGYKPMSETLTIQFHDGRIYEYYHVPQHVYNGLMLAPSKGKYHHRYIKNSYPYKRIR